MQDTDNDAPLGFVGPRELAYRVVAMPADTNAAGDIFGGWLMSQIDIAGSVLAIREARGRVATVAVESMRFIAPIKVGDLVSCYAQVVSVGNTSVKVHIEAEASRQRSHDIEDQDLVAEATFVYVALDEQGRPRPVHHD